MRTREDLKKELSSKIISELGLEFFNKKVDERVKSIDGLTQALSFFEKDKELFKRKVFDVVVANNRDKSEEVNMRELVLMDIALDRYIENKLIN